MGWLSATSGAVADASKVVGKSADDIKIKPTTFLEPTSVKPVEPVKPRTTTTTPTKPIASGATVGALGLGVGGLGFVLPSILNSSAVSSAISGASQIGVASVVGDQVAGVANNLIDDVTSNPLNMGLATAGGVALLYLLFR